MATAPGKIILMGEHAVVYGRPALVAALGLRVRARLERASDLDANEVELRLPDVGCRETVPLQELLAYAEAARERWERHHEAGGTGDFRAVRGEDPAHVVKVALGEASRAADRPRPAVPGLRLTVTSDVPVGCGFGSSAAVGAAVSGVWLAWHGVSLSGAERERLLLDVERRQHESPSGVDGAAVLRGGAIWAQPRAGGKGLRVRSEELHADHLARFRVVDTGTPAQDTGTVVAAVRRRRDRRPDRVEAILDRMGESTRRFRRAVGDGNAAFGEVARPIRTYQRGLEGLGVVPPGARRVVREAEARGGAAKISGAGALESPPRGPPSAGALLVYHPEPDGVAAWEPLEGLTVYGVEVGAEGHRVEGAG